MLNHAAAGIFPAAFLYGCHFRLLLLVSEPVFHSSSYISYHFRKDMDHLDISLLPFF